MACLDNIIEINKSDCIGNSRETINSNFSVLKDKVCSLDTKTDVVEKKSIYYVPLYGIIMYYGDITLGGTDFELNGYGKESKNLQAFAICDGSNGTPDMRDRFVVGAGGNYTQKTYGPQAPGTPASTTNDTLSLQFSSVRLTIDEMPTHNHGITDPQHDHGGYTAEDGKHRHKIDMEDMLKRAGPDDENDNGNTGFENYNGDKFTETDGEHKHVINKSGTGITINNEGGSFKHENRPPYIALGYIMRVK